MRGWGYTLILLVFLSGCIGSNSPERQFVCWDRSIVSNPGLCPRETTTSSAPETTTLTTTSTSIEASSSSTVAATSSSSTTLPPDQDFAFRQSTPNCGWGRLSINLSAVDDVLHFWGTVATSTPSYKLSALHTYSRDALRIYVNAEQTSEAGIDCLGEISFEGLARNIPEGIWMIDLYYDSRKILPVNYAVFSDGVSLRFLCGGSTKAFCPVGSMCAIPDIHVSDYDGVCVNLDSVSESAAGSSTTIPEASSSTTLAYSTTLPTTSMVRIPFTPSPATSTMRIPFTPSPASSSGTPVIEIIEAQFDAPGSEKINLNGEWVKIRNNGDAPQDLTGWILEDDANHIYRFPDNFVLGTGDSVTVHTGSGTDSTSDLYWGRGSAIWNNDGDTATLRDEEGRKIDSHEE